MKDITINVCVKVKHKDWYPFMQHLESHGWHFHRSSSDSVDNSIHHAWINGTFRNFSILDSELETLQRVFHSDKNVNIFISHMDGEYEKKEVKDKKEVKA